MKYLFYGLLAVAVLMAGHYYFFGREEPEPIVEQSSHEVSGEVVEVNLDAIVYDGPATIIVEGGDHERHTIAVPSMGLPLCAAYERITPVHTIAVGDTVTARGERGPEGEIVPCADEEHFLNAAVVVYDDEEGYTFTYAKGPVGYTQVAETESEHEDFVEGMLLFDTEEYAEFQQSTEPREGPPAMHVRVYENPELLSALEWAAQNPRESNSELAIGEKEERIVGGANAVRYTVDGLYRIDTYIITQGDYIYVLMGSYRDTNEAIYQDFQSLLASFTFVPTEEHSKG